MENILRVFYLPKRRPSVILSLEKVDCLNTDAFAFGAGGVASALISLPLRYMHTTVEMVHKDDVENVIRLIYNSVLSIEDNHDFRYIK